MATLVWKTYRGNLQQVQVGPADLAATFSAIKATWGWLGGLDGIRNVITNVPGISQSATLGDVGVNLNLQPSSCHILTQGGTLVLEDTDINSSFGGHQVTQLIGMTLCALAHVLGKDRAVELFMTYLADFLCDAKDGICEALNAQLIDNIQLITNEGATRGLSVRFQEAIDHLNLHPLLKKRPQQRRNKAPWAHGCLTEDPADMRYVAGLLRWIRSGKNETYLTRSAVVAHVAVCLREIGFLLGHISVYDQRIDSDLNKGKGVTIVVGGTIETDSLVPDDLSILKIPKPPLHHYRTQTVGSMLFNLFDDRNEILPEVFMSRFLTVSWYIKDNLWFSWKAEGYKPVRAHAEWKPTHDRRNHIALSLASIYFTSCPEKFAPCYEAIATEEVLRIVRTTNGQSDAVFPPFAELIHFRLVTLAIILSIAEILGGSNFDSLNHSVAIAADGTTISDLSRKVNSSLSVGFTFSQAVALVAIFHCGADPGHFCGFTSLNHVEATDIVGYRSGEMAVLPALLFELTPTASSLGIRCVDKFHSLPVQSDGTIRCENGSEAWTSASLMSVSHPLTPEELLPNVAPSPPTPTPADTSIYLSFERVPSSSKPYLCIAARCYGRLIGTVTIPDILMILGTSLNIPRKCPSPGHVARAHALSLRCSDWVVDRFIKPTNMKANYIAAAGHDHWAIFMAGQLRQNFGLISFECFDCTLDVAKLNGSDESTTQFNTFIGYGSRENN